MTEQRSHYPPSGPQHSALFGVPGNRHSFPCECGPDSTGEAPDERPWCPQHGIVPALTALLGKPYCSRHDEIPRNCWELHTGATA